MEKIKLVSKKYSSLYLAEELLKWAHKDDSMSLNQFSWEQQVPFTQLTQFSKTDDHFKDAWELAKAILAFRRENKMNEGYIDTKVYTLNAYTYDLFLREEIMSRKEAEYRLKAMLDDADIQRKLISKDEKIIELETKIRQLEESNAIQ